MVTAQVDAAFAEVERRTERVIAVVRLAVLVHCLWMFTAASGQPFEMSLDSPAAWVIFVLLGAAAVRHRPLLVLYIGGLFAAAWLLAWELAELIGEWPPAVVPGVSGIARLTIVGLVAFALFIGVRRARDAMVASLRTS